MASKGPRRWSRIILTGAMVLLILALCGLGGSRLLSSYFVRQYYQSTYTSQPLSTSALAPYPASHRLAGVPWTSTALPLSQSTSLQMIAAQHSIDRPRRHFDFLMGFTYGAGEIPGQPGFAPNQDPEPGFLVAAPYLGLVRRYLTTDDPVLYVKAIRSYVSQGYAVRVPLDMATLYAAQGQIPHSEVVVGYDEAGFYYYETVCRAPATCQPGQKPPGDPGLFVPDRRMLDAVAAESTAFGYPWRYMLVIFDKGPTSTDLKPIWLRNGQGLVGADQYGIRSGSVVIERLATLVRQEGSDFDTPGMRSGLETAAYASADNATYLRETFPGQPNVEPAAQMLERAGNDFAAALAALKAGVVAGDAGQIAGWLHDAAVAEHDAGMIFERLGE